MLFGSERPSKRDRLRQVAEDNTRIFESGTYVEGYGHTTVDIAAELAQSKAATRVLSAGGEAAPNPGDGDPTWVGIGSETTLDALLMLHSEWVRNIAVLNFASATTPGGGYLRGGEAQEESLCRATTLHDSLLGQPEFYARNTALKDPVYEDTLILSPQSMVIRDHFHFLLPEPFPCAVLSCPAPNRTALIERDAGGRDLARADDAITRRIALILDTVASLKPGATILGGWGCGVFGNDPGLVAKRFVEALKKRPNLGRIHFALPDAQTSVVGRAFAAELQSNWYLPR